MDELIRKYIKKDDAKLLHKIRINARKELSKLEKEGLVDKGLKKLLKKSSKLRDIDVLLKICKSKKIKKYLKKKKKKLREKLLMYLKTFKNDIKPLCKKRIEKKLCFDVLKESFLDKNDEELHKIRVIIKKCRYAYNLPLRKIQNLLGKAHDYYNCEELLLKFGKNPTKVLKKKLKYVKKAEKSRLEIVS